MSIVRRITRIPIRSLLPRRHLLLFRLFTSSLPQSSRLFLCIELGVAGKSFLDFTGKKAIEHVEYLSFEEKEMWIEFLLSGRESASYVLIGEIVEVLLDARLSTPCFDQEVWRDISGACRLPCPMPEQWFEGWCSSSSLLLLYSCCYDPAFVVDMTNERREVDKMLITSVRSNWWIFWQQSRRSKIKKIVKLLPWINQRLRPDQDRSSQSGYRGAV